MSSEEGSPAASRRRRRGCPRLPAAAPLDDDDLLSEILLRLPPQPSSLPRASLVCNRWRRLVSARGFLRRFRIRHRSNLPLLGCFVKTNRGLSFVPTLEAPNRIPPGRFSWQSDDGERFQCLGCRHGLVLIFLPERVQVLVWDPVTGDERRLAVPLGFSPFDDINGAVVRAAGDLHFQVVLVGSDGKGERAVARIYSSETSGWGNFISTPLPSEIAARSVPAMVFSSMPNVLVGDSLCWLVFAGSLYTIEFDLDRQSLAVIQVPVGVSEHASSFAVMRAEGGGLGLLLVSELDFGAQFWKRKTDCDGVASWELGGTFELDKLLSLNSEERQSLIILGFAECNDVVFLSTCVGLFMVQRKSLQFKKLSGTNGLCHPFESVYAADVNAAPAPLDFIEGSKSVRSPTKLAAVSRSMIVPAATHSTIKSQIEVPRQPQTTIESPQKRPLESLVVGNKHYEMMLLSEGRFGIFYKRENTENAWKWAEIDVAVYRRSIYFTMEEVLRRCMVKAGYENDEDIGRLLTRYVPQLVNGVCMLTYLKIRSVNMALSPEGDRYAVKPKVPVLLEVPLPFAIAISQLGTVEVKSMPRLTIAFPAISVAEAAHFMIPQNQCFKAADYAQAVKFSKSLGIEFSTVDLDKKMGSAWWLLRGEITEEGFHLSLPLPESNFSEDDAILHSMFCLNPDRSFGTTLFTLGELNAGTYGSILRNPHKGMNANSFFALCSGPLRTMWMIE